MNNDWKERLKDLKVKYTEFTEWKDTNGKYNSTSREWEGFIQEEEAIDLINYIQSEIDKAVEQEIDEDKHHVQMLHNRMKVWIDEWRKEDYKNRKLIIPDIMNLINWKLDKTKKEAKIEVLREVEKGLDMFHCEDNLYKITYDLISELEGVTK